MKIAYWISFAVGLLVLLGAVTYCWQNESGHSGLNPLNLLIVFGPLFVIGLAGRLMTKGRWLSARLVEGIGFVGMAFSIFVTRLGIFNQYEDWISAGMPERNPHATLLLTGFVIGVIGGVIAIAILITPRAKQGGGHQAE